MSPFYRWANQGPEWLGRLLKVKFSVWELLWGYIQVQSQGLSFSVYLCQTCPKKQWNKNLLWKFLVLISLFNVKNVKPFIKPSSSLHADWAKKPWGHFEKVILFRTPIRWKLIKLLLLLIIYNLSKNIILIIKICIHDSEVSYVTTYTFVNVKR